MTTIKDLKRACREIHEPFAGMLVVDSRTDTEIAEYEAEQEKNIDHANDNRI